MRSARQTRDPRYGVVIGFEAARTTSTQYSARMTPPLHRSQQMALLVGAERADDTHRSRRALHVEAILSSMPTIDYTLDVARVHARLAVQAMTTGRPRSAYDMIVAAVRAPDIE